MLTIIRIATPADGPALAEIYRPAVTESATSFELEPPDSATMAARIENVLKRTPWLVCERDGTVLGYAYASMHRERPAYQWSVEVSAYVHRDAKRVGIASSLYSALFEMLSTPGFCNAYAGVTLPNDASVGFHIAMGFTPVGVYHGVGYKNGEWHDVGWFERSVRPRTDNPGSIVPY